jgi:nitroreductase
MRVLDAGRLAPSARNLQDWKFIEVKDKETLSALLLSMRSHSVILVILYRHDLIVLYPDPAFPDQICEKRIQNGISHTHMPSQSAPLHLSAAVG